ncbi:sulfate adenylyltransferase subunit CysN [Lentisphaerota bacterium WC36G]|nr:sulfate adenylyltransferase subunit CysN [Lentisphaerae bacterium WC36]
MDIGKFLDKHENKTLLRFITCGSVDDGKSTLIGRLLYDSKLIFEDQLSVLKKDSKKIGTVRDQGKIDYALLLDGLKAEREQGITIDVAYRYFSTPERKFIIADTPGHEQYTRNMATGASTASLAVLLIDARRGILTQTKRHSFIASLLGIKHIVVAVNKMDLVDYSQEIFEEIKGEFAKFAENFQFETIEYFPLSALDGANVVNPTPELTPWYDGKGLLNYLENIDVSQQLQNQDFRYPVQYVIRPNLDFRGFAGSVVSGTVNVGDEVRVLPSNKKSKVKEIVTYDGNLAEAFAPLAVTLTLEDEIDISSGDLIVKDNEKNPQKGSDIIANVIWMVETPLETNKNYLIRHNGKIIKGKVAKLNFKTNVNTLENSATESLQLNEIGSVEFSLFTDIFYDSYPENHETGNFIIIDPLSNNTVGVGLII